MVWETVYFERGHPCRVWSQPRLPRIPDKFLDTVIYLYPTVEDAKAGERMGGTGFIVAFKTPAPAVWHYYAVTCAHVIHDGGPVIRLNTKDGEWDVVSREKADWLEPPDGTDLAICPIEFSDQHKYNYVGIGDFLSEQLLKEFNIGPGDDVFMVGRFINHEGKQRNLPTMRFGNLSMLPWEKLRGWQGVEQESFLVDMRSRTGYSGSPVFLYIAPTEIRMGQRYWTGEQARTFYGPWLLGVDWGHISLHSKVLGPIRDKNGKRLPVDDDWDVESHSGMNAVTPAWKLLSFLMNDADLNEQRSKRINDA